MRSTLISNTFLAFLDSVLGSSHLDQVGLNEINNQALTKGYLDFISLTLI